MSETQERATFLRTEASSAKGRQKIAGEYRTFAAKLPERLIAHLKLLEVSEFEPMVHRVFARPRHSLYEAATAEA